LKIKNHPFIQDPDLWKKDRPFRVAVIQQCSYDGTINNAEIILKKIGHLCDYILFDEAWAGFMKFHPIYKGRFGMGLQNLKHNDP
jgi:arginine/lysine/ornithine decarboxylase